MITVEEAKELCILAHRGQWRRGTKITTEHTDEWNSLVRKTGRTKSNILSNGSKIINRNDGFYIEKPYHTHPIAVAEMLDTDEEKIAAYLHDVIEDTSAELKSTYILFEGTKYPISDRIWCILYVLTKLNDDWDKFTQKGVYQPYGTYIRQIAENKVATKVKLADITSNLLDNPSQRQMYKYKAAMKILLASL